MRICYYDLLDIERQATSLDIKKAYRKQALIWHPDKNGDRIQEATDRFSLIQEAYEVLSDPQERAWYDGHRDSILRGTDNKHKDSSAGTTAEDLMRYFSVSEFKGYEDTPKVGLEEEALVATFLAYTLANEEEEAFRNNPPENDDDVHSATSYPSFGNASTPFADNDGYLGYGAYVRDFYGAWSNFSSMKSFIWMDKWKLSDAPSRYVRRQMEKENKKARDTGRKEYNDTVRSLAEFVRKRDPRVKAYLVEEQKRKEAVAAEQKARIQREKQELQAKVADYQTPEWAKVEDDIDSELEDDEEEQEEEVNEFYCVVCDKGYKSEKQFASHESSKRHIDNVEILRQEMLADEENFDFGNGTPSIDNLDGGIPVDEEDLAAQLDELELLQQQQEEEEEVIHVAPSSHKKKKKKNKAKMAPNWGFDEEAVPEEMDEMAILAAALEEEKSKRRGRKGNNRASSPAPPNEVSPTDTEDTQEKEAAVSVEKESAKTKREKRKEKKKLKEENATSENACNVCGDQFETRNQLFSHINETGHALAISGSKGGNKKGNKRR
ncbi:DnaJ homolog subfamily C member 21 [Mucor ambiguus]|uniref:DnaJ homolog subfamily C member 21 n=1 Tax=Mucor ambiguus TaxID=91626 RepID=A0A0C9M4P4_9FUNG|nr:DnaJ homolog subfamily C member 21 [Mucor ambiguus]